MTVPHAKGQLLPRITTAEAQAAPRTQAPNKPPDEREASDRKGEQAPTAREKSLRAARGDTSAPLDPSMTLTRALAQGQPARTRAVPTPSLGEQASWGGGPAAQGRQARGPGRGVSRSRRRRLGFSSRLRGVRPRRPRPRARATHERWDLTAGPSGAAPSYPASASRQQGST